MMFIFFLLLGPVVMLNLLIAMFSSVYAGVEQSASGEFLLMRAKFIMQVQERLSAYMHTSCMYTSTHARMHTCIHVYTCTIHAHAHTCMHACMHVQKEARLSTYIHAGGSEALTRGPMALLS